MTTEDDDATIFDRALIAAAFAYAGNNGWRGVTPEMAARSAGLDPARARARFRNRFAILRRFGELSDRATLAGTLGEGSVKETLFDLLMRRFDSLQPYRAGVVKLLNHLPRDPALAFCLLHADRRSLRAVMGKAGLATTGCGAELTLKGLLLVWLAGMRAFARDDSADLSATMRAVDEALNRADQAVKWLPACATVAPAPPSAADPMGPEAAPIAS
jgi:hypothetical protein